MIIYKATNKINGKIYIGQTINSLEFRKQQHFREAKSNSKVNTYFHNALNKYGLDNFLFEAIDNADNIDDLNRKEIYWISYYQSTNKSLGYNLDSGGKSGGCKSESTKRKIGDKTKERWQNENIAERMRDGLKKGTETVKRNKQEYEFVCPVCGKRITGAYYTIKNRRYCSNKCAARNGVCSKATAASAIANHQRTIEFKQMLKPVIIEWILEHDCLVISCPYNHITSTLHDLFEILKRDYGIKDVRTIFDCFNVNSRKELLDEFKLIIYLSKENIC